MLYPNCFLTLHCSGACGIDKECVQACQEQYGVQFLIEPLSVCITERCLSKCGG
jgi:hypothetical protein